MDFRERGAATARILAGLTAGAAVELGAGWTAEHEPGDWGGSHRLHGPGGALLRIDKDGYGDVPTRVEVLGLFSGVSAPRHWHENHKITVAVSRGPVALAREITRRLLPDYLPALEAAQQREADAVARVARLADRAEQLRALLPGGYVISHACTESNFEMSVPGREVDGTVSLRYDGATGALQLRRVPVELLFELVVVLDRAGSEVMPVG